MPDTGTLTRVPLDQDALARLLDVQSGVVTRAQLRDLGVAKHDVERMVRRRELVALGRSVFLSHTGEPTWVQRAWAATLACAPAAMCLASAAPVPSETGPVHVAIDESRRVAPVPGVRLHRLTGLTDKVRWQASPTRLRPEHDALELAHRARDELGVVRVLTDELHARRTTAARLQDVLMSQTRLRRRSFVVAVLADLAAGTCSVLEHGYLERVARPHGFPAATSPVTASPRGCAGNRCSAVRAPRPSGWTGCSSTGAGRARATPCGDGCDLAVDDVGGSGAPDAPDTPS